MPRTNGHDIAAWGDREEKEEKIRGRGDKVGLPLEEDRYMKGDSATPS